MRGARFGVSLASRAAIFAAWCAEEESGGAEPTVSSSSSSIAGYESSGLTGGGRAPARGGGAASNVDWTEEATVLPSSSSYSSHIIIVVHAQGEAPASSSPPSRGLSVPPSCTVCPRNWDSQTLLSRVELRDALRNKAFQEGLVTKRGRQEPVVAAELSGRAPNQGRRHPQTQFHNFRRSWTHLNFPFPDLFSPLTLHLNSLLV